jgi:hypothetical protein
MLPSVINLKASRTTHGFDVEVDMIQSYLSGLADMTIELSQPLL